MTDQIVVYDTEYWTDEGVMHRNWSGLRDFPPLLVQIAAFKVRLIADWPIVGEYVGFVRPVDEFGQEAPITDYFAKLTGVDQAFVDAHARSLRDVICEFAALVGSDLMYSYGTDVLATILPSCYLASIPCPFAPTQVRDLRQVLARVGLTEEEVYARTSGTLASLFGIELANHRVHDASSDARSLIASLRHLRASGRLPAEWLLRPARPLRTGRTRAVSG